VITRAGGKSLIVARTIRRLGGQAAVYGFLGGPVGQFIRDGCAALGLRDHHLSIAGDTRITQVLVESRTGQSTVVNEPGPVVGPEDAERLLSQLQADCQPGDLVVCTGSLPRGLPEDYHAQIVGRVAARGGRAVVDASGAALRLAVEARPWLVKPNLAEFRGLDGRHAAIAEAWSSAQAPAQLAAAMAVLVRRGIEHVIVTLGADGLIYTDRDHTLHVRSPRISVRNPTGSGDTFLAAFVWAQSRGTDLEATLRFAAAAGAANAARIEPDLDGPGEVEALLDQVQIRELRQAGTR
jgi:1-phosphofructokinase family hexose kinase